MERASSPHACWRLQQLPVVNMHAGITPRYRGVHGGYWALAEQHPGWVGSTVHLVDAGIDTGGILAQDTFEVSDQDTIATYPDLHLMHGLPLLAAQMEKVLSGLELAPLPTSLAPGTGLYYHPTLWGYLWRRWRWMPVSPASLSSVLRVTH